MKTAQKSIAHYCSYCSTINTRSKEENHPESPPWQQVAKSVWWSLLMVESTKINKLRQNLKENNEKLSIDHLCITMVGNRP